VQSVNLAWSPSPDTNVVGYRVYYGVASRTYTNMVDVGAVTNATIGGLVEGKTYYFAATAYNILGLESDYSAEISYTIPGGSVNQAPTLNALNNLTINEDAGQQTVALSGISSGASNEVQTLTVTASSGNTAVVPNPTVTYTSANTNGTLTFTPVANANGSALITVTVNDGGATNSTITRTFTVTVNAVNDAPTLNALNSVTINEDAGQQTVNLSGIGSGASNESQPLTVTATSGNTAVVPNPTVTYTSANTTGTLAFTPVASASGSALITVTVSDGGTTNSSITRTFTVTVSGVNDTPTLDALNNLTINEDAGQQTVTLTGITSGAGNESQVLTVTASSGNTAVVPNPTVTYTSANTTGTLTFTPVANASGSALITVTVNDGGSTNNTITRTFTVTVNAVNDVPTLNALSDVTISENAGQQTVNLSGIGSGASNESQTLTVTASSGNTAVVPNPAVTYTSANATGTLTYTPVTNAYGSALISVTVNDNGTSNNIVTRTFTVTVSQGNTPPTISGIANLTIATNTSSSPTAFTIGDAQTAAASLTLSATSSSATLIPSNNIVFGGSGSNRTVTLTPLANQSGTATITITVSDGSASTSTSFQLTVLGSPAAPVGFTLVISGNGMVSPDLSAQQMKLGETYTLTAVPAASNQFAGWSGGIASADPQLTFVMTSNLVLQANFVPAALDQAAGSYSGLFYEADEVRTTSAGAFTVKITPKGKYSGRLQAGSQKGSFTGILDAQGQATNTVYLKNSGAVTVELRLGAGAYADRVFGHVSNAGFKADLLGDRAMFNAKTNPASFAGNFTLLLPGQCGAGVAPVGNGFGTVRVGANGRIKFKGALADGTKISQSTTASRNGDWPFYVPVYSGQGLALSWMAFTNQADSDVSGKLSWIKLPSFLARYYPTGLTNECDAVGSVFVRPAGSPILNLPSGRVAISGGNLLADFTNSVTLGADNKVMCTGDSPLSMSFSLSAGTFTGKATDPSSGLSLPFRGVVLQKKNRGYGFLLGSDRSSEVVFEP
jgi:hypothetical protein